MRFTVNKNIIENIISSMQPFLEKKDASSITSHIYFEIYLNQLILRSTDYEMGLEAKIDDITDYEDGNSTVNGSDLLNIVKRLKNENIIFEVINNNLSIKQNKTNFKLPMYNPEEYPKFPSIKELKKLDINLFNFNNSIKKIAPAIDNNNPKFELNGALIDIKSNKINFVSTDTRRLAIANLQNISNNNEVKLIIPKKAVIEIQKIFFDDAIIIYDEINLILSNKNLTFYTKLLNGEFPDYQRIIPNNLNHSFKLSRSLLINAIKLVTSLKPNIKITFSPDYILFESVDENSEAKTQIDIKLNIDSSFYIAANSRHILDFLSCSLNENIILGFNKSNLPLYLEDDNFITIIMPIILEN